MSAKPPVLPSAVPPRVAGLATAPTPKPATPVVVKHVCEVENNSNNPQAKYPFVLRCSCGYVFQTYSVESAAQAQKQHLQSV
jgi:hypothetical protein